MSHTRFIFAALLIRRLSSHGLRDAHQVIIQSYRAMNTFDAIHIPFQRIPHALQSDSMQQKKKEKNAYPHACGIV